MKPTAGLLNRRAFLNTSVAGLGVAMAMPGFVGKALAAEGSVVVGDGGGPYTKAFDEIFHAPFRAETGIKSIQVARNSVEAQAVAQVRAQVETGAFQWDAVTFGEPSAVQLAKLDLLASVHAEGLDFHDADMMPGALTDTYVGVYYSGLVIAYRTDAFPSEKAPKTWADFWDVDKFPGSRGVFKTGMDLMEPAVLSAGVSPGSLYPIDVELAFAQLDKLKPHVRTWFDSLAASTQALLDGSLDMVMTFPSRAGAAIAQGAPSAIAWDQWIAQSVGFVIPKGAPNVDNARKFLARMTDPEAQAKLVTYVAVGPTNAKAYDHIDPAVAKTLPGSPATRAGMISLNPEWRSANSATIVPRFASWIEA